MIAGLLLAGCSSGRAASDPGRSAAACELQLTAPVLALAAPVSWTPPESHITAELELSTALLARELEHQVPRQLASASGRDIGLAGEVSYRVERGGFGFGVHGASLAVTTPIKVEVEVCKRLGPVCLLYGACQPRLRADVSLPLLMDAQYRLGPSQVTVKVERGCVLQPIGLDQSARIHQAARDQQVMVKRRVDGLLPDIRADVASVWRILHTPVAIDNSLCLRIRPTGVDQQHPKLSAPAAGSDQTLTTRISIRGEVRVEDACQATQDAGPITPLPAPTLASEVAPDVALEVPIFLEWSDVTAQLNRALSGQRVSTARGEIQIAKVSVQPTSQRGKSRLALTLTLSGVACGQVKFLTDIDVDMSRKVLVLRSIAPLKAGEASLPDEATQRLTALVLRRVALDLPVDLSAAPSTLEGLVRRLTQDLPPQVKLSLQVEPAKVSQIIALQRALVPVISLNGHARLSAR